MTSFYGQDRASGSEEDRIGKEVGSSEVGSNTDVFHDTCDVGHGRDISQDLGKIKRAIVDRFVPKSLDGLLRKSKSHVKIGTKGWRNENPLTHLKYSCMNDFIIPDTQKLLDGKLRARKSGSGKIAFLELGKSLRIKRGL